MLPAGLRLRFTWMGAFRCVLPWTMAKGLMSRTGLQMTHVVHADNLMPAGTVLMTPELDEVAGESEVWVSLLRLLPSRLDLR